MRSGAVGTKCRPTYAITIGCLLASAAVSVIDEQRAAAAGFYFSERGVRPLGRGGAFVAGADDVGAIAYNPAGLADAGTSFLLDASWLNFSVGFERKAQVFDAGGTARLYQFPRVVGTTPFIPIPTIGVSARLDAAGNWVLGAGIYAPYGAIPSFPQTQDGRPAASRYSLSTADGSALAIASVNLAYKVREDFRIGFGLQTMFGAYSTTVVLNTNPADRLIGAPEDPNYDARSQTTGSPIITWPSVNLGATWIPTSHIRLAVSGYTPFYVNAPANVQVQFPSAPLFDRARQEGSNAALSFWLAPVARIGVEYRTQWSTASELRVEATYVREFWSVHKQVTITPKDINLVGLIGFPSPFPTGPTKIARNFEDSNSIRFGAELTVPSFYSKNAMTFRLGANFETSAIPTDYVTPIATDANKLAISAGLGLYFGKRWRLDGMFSQIFSNTVNVDPATAKLKPLSPVTGNDAPFVPINGGSYDMRAMVVGFGLNYRFDADDPAQTKKKLVPTEPPTHLSQPVRPLAVADGRY